MPLFWTHLVVIGLSLLVLLASFFKSWIYRFQTFTTSLMGIFAAIGIVYAACFLGIAWATAKDVGENTIFDPAYFPAAAIFGIAYLGGAIVVHILLLRKRLREGHSAARAMGNLAAVSGAYKAKSFWIISGVVAIATIAGNTITRGQYTTFTIGTLAFLVFASITPSLPIELAYLTHLKAHDRRYWESRPPKVPKKESKASVLSS